MELQVNIVTVILFITFLISAGITLYSWLKGYLKGQVYFTLMMLCASEYAFASMVEASVITIEMKVLWSKFQYVGVSFATLLLLHFVLNLINSKFKGLLRWFSLLYFVPVTVIVLAWTNEYHNLVWTGYTWSADGSNILTYHHGFAYHFFAGWSLLLIALSIYVLIRELPKFPDTIKNQIRIIIAGCMAPFIMTLLYLADISPVEGLDLTTMSLPVLGIIFLVGIFRFGMFNIIPSVSRQITNVIHDGLMVLDENGAVVFYNSSAAELFGMKQTEFAYQKINDIPWLNEIISTRGEGFKETQVMINPDPEKWLEISTKPIMDEGNNFRGYLIMLHDITKRKRLEHQTRNLLDELNISHDIMAEANSQKDRLMSIIAHDLRTTFHQVINLTGIIHEMLEELTEEQLKEYLTDLRKASEHGYSILEDLLTWAKSQKAISQANEHVKVVHSIEQIIASMALSLQGKDLEVKIEGDSDMTIVTDGNVLSMVVRNLLANAIKFSNKSSLIHVNCVSGEAYDAISISDSGIGIPEADLPKLFDTKVKYTRAGTNGESGSGLGLLLCKEMIERNRGSIEVESKEGVGSTFTIKFSRDAVPGV